jgi:hypothetical protein
MIMTISPCDDCLAPKPVTREYFGSVDTATYCYVPITDTAGYLFTSDNGAEARLFADTQNVARGLVYEVRIAKLVGYSSFEDALRRVGFNAGNCVPAFLIAPNSWLTHYILVEPVTV